MDSAKIEYEVENIEDNQQALKLARQVGGMGFPFVVFSPTDYIAGNTEKIIEKLMLKIPEVEKVEELFFWGK